ncbi:serine hydrolase [Bacillus sp. USDA818B3_A]|uniref:serine hydrolase n=1 Tax=Bacillus sp. USDA818B3_A TaxID=2698834 RepID=UPI00136A918E|nr:serine hydrolase [Bacillus sp. USDA818B3_A]
MFKKLAALALSGIILLSFGKTDIHASASTILGPEVTNYIASRSNTVSVGVFDASTGKTYTYNPSKTYYTMSVVKMSIMADVLYQKIPITSNENSLLTRMIQISDNSAASTLWRQLGSDRNVQAFFRKVGMTHTTAGTGGWWGRTTTTVGDQLTMMKYFAYPNTLLSDSQRAYGLNLMKHVRSDQRWGTGSGLPSGVSVALKNGWVTSNPPSKLFVNSVGYVNGKGKDYIIAVLTTNNRSLSYGIETINKISSLVWNEMPQHLPTIGVMDTPANGSTIKGKNIVKGWFLDESGVSKIDILIDGKAVGQAAYGDTRSDVQKAYPKYNNGKAGFHYTVDTTKFSDGKHTVTIKETGKNGRVTTLPGKTLTIGNTKGCLDTPVPGTTLSETKNVRGWFLDELGVAKIEILVDGALAGQAVYGDTRSDVLKAYPQFNNGKAGFHYTLNTNKYSNGKHTIVVKETSRNGRTKTLPAISITIKH